jgi:hypothetical protein
VATPKLNPSQSFLKENTAVKRLDYILYWNDTAPNSPALSQASGTSEIPQNFFGPQAFSRITREYRFSLRVLVIRP